MLAVARFALVISLTVADSPVKDALHDAANAVDKGDSTALPPIRIRSWYALANLQQKFGDDKAAINCLQKGRDIACAKTKRPSRRSPSDCIGQPGVLTFAEADAELQRLTLLRKNHLDEQNVARRSVRDLPWTIARLSENLSQLMADQATATAHAADLITIGKRTWSRNDTLPSTEIS